YRGAPRVDAFFTQPVPGGDGILQRGGKRVLRSEPVIDRGNLGARRRGEAPGDVAVELERSGHVAAAMQEEDVAVGARAGHGDAERRDPAEIAAPYFGVGRGP